jgi:penicillin amidase
MMRWTKRFGLGTGVLLIGAGVVGILVLRASLPQTNGTVALPDLEKPVRVLRDAHGVPSILAANQHDLYMALGFVHAQDRLFQMDMQRRVGAGRLSEVVGAAGVATDRLMRTLGIYRRATAGLNAASSEFFSTPIRPGSTPSCTAGRPSRLNSRCWAIGRTIGRPPTAW